MELKISKDATINANDLVTGRTCVIGQSGSGKSYAIAVICEELAKKGIGFCIIDTEGEYYTLKEKYPLLWVGDGASCDININEVTFTKLAKESIAKNVPIIFDVSDVENQRELVSKFLRAIYLVNSKLKKPYLVIIEEADKFAPQRGEVLPVIEEISRRGRKRGIGLLIATQRPAFVNKDILSQCGSQLIGKLTISNDLKAVKMFFPNRKDVELLPQLEAGKFFLQFGLSEPKLITIRKRETPHAAATPLIKVNPKKNKDIESIKKELSSETLSEEVEVEEVGFIGVKPVVKKEEVVEKIKKRMRRFRFFGKAPSISEIHFLLYPIYSCEIKYLKKKIVGQEFITINTYFSGVGDGDIVSLAKGFKVVFKLDGLLGLDTRDLEVFKKICDLKKATTTDIAQELKISPETARLSIKELIKQGLISYKKVGRHKVYFPFTKLRLPKLKKLVQKEVPLNRLKLSAKKLDFEVEPQDLSSFVRSLGEKTDIVGSKKIYYPFFEVRILLKNKEKVVYVDAVTGKFVKLVF